MNPVFKTLLFCGALCLSSGVLAQNRPAPSEPFEAFSSTSPTSSSAPAPLPAFPAATTPGISPEEPSPAPAPIDLNAVLSGATPVSKEPTPVTESEQPATRRNYSQQEKLLLLKLSMAEASVKLTPGPAARDELVTLLEEATGLFCMPDLFSKLQHTALPDDPDCRKHLARLKEMHSTNAIAICAEKGIDSSDCHIAFSDQQVADFGSAPATAARASHQAAQKLAANTAQLSAFNEPFGRAVETWRMDSSDENLNNLKAMYEQVFSLSCVASHTLLVETTLEEIKQRLSPSVNNSPYMQQLAQEVERLRIMSQRESLSPQQRAARDTDIYAKKTAEEAKKEGKNPGLFRRIRLITTPCFLQTQEALKLIPFFPAAVCNYNGFYSPACILTLRKNRGETLIKKREQDIKRWQEKTGEKGLPQDGLGSF